MSRRSPALLLTLALLALLVANSADFFFRTPYYESWDLAANSLSIHRAKHFAELYGPYSRWGFHHPGPAYFYALALGEWLFHDLLHLAPAPYNAQALAQLCISLAFYGATLAIFARRLPRGAGSWFWPLAISLGALHFGFASGLPSYDFLLGPSAFTSTWSAHELVLPLLCLLASGASVASGNERDLPLLAISAGTLLHLHVAQPLFVGPLVLLSFFGLAATCPRRAFRGRHTMAAALIFTVFALPLALDLFRGADSNLAAIVHHLRTHHGEHKSLAKSLLYFLQFGADAPYQPGRLDFGRFSGPGAWEYLRAHAPSLAGWLLILLIAAAVALRPSLRVKSRLHATPDPAGLGRFLSWSGAFLLAAILLTLFWGTIQDGEMFYYNSWLNFAIYYFGLLIVAANFSASRAARLLPVGGGRLLLHLLERLAPAALAAVICLSLAGRWRVRDAAPETTALLHGSIVRVLSAARSGDVAFEFPSAEWPVAVALGLEMARAGRPFDVEDRWVGPVGRDHAESLLPPERLRAAVPWRFEMGPGAIPWRGDSPGSLAPSTRRLRERLAAGKGFPLPDDTSLTISLPIIEPGDGPPGEIDFRDGKARGYELCGWSDAEPWGAWSDGPRGILRFAAHGPAGGGPGVVLTAELHAFVSPAAGLTSQRLRVRFDGEPLGPEARITGETQTITWMIPASLWNRAASRSVGTSLEFELPDAASPAALDPAVRNADTRLLGVGIRRLGFRPAVPPPPR